MSRARAPAGADGRSTPPAAGSSGNCAQPPQARTRPSASASRAKPRAQIPPAAHELPVPAPVLVLVLALVRNASLLSRVIDQAVEPLLLPNEEGCQRRASRAGTKWSPPAAQARHTAPRAAPRRRMRAPLRTRRAAKGVELGLRPPRRRRRRRAPRAPQKRSRDERSLKSRPYTCSRPVSCLASGSAAKRAAVSAGNREVANTLAPHRSSLSATWKPTSTRQRSGRAAELSGRTWARPGRATAGRASGDGCSM